MKNLEINTLNINSNSLLNIATFRQEDNATLMLELYKNGQSIDLTGQKIILGAERSDGSIIEQEEDISTNENIVTIKLKKNILAVNGLVKMQLTLSDREGTMSTTSFNINVDRKILGAENIKASNDIETINSLVLDLKTNVNKAITDTKDKASTLLSGLEDTANSVELKVNALTDISNGLLKNLENQCKDSTIINTELSNNIQQALPINTELKENIKIGQPLVQEATTKNTELQASLEKTKEFIEGLDGSQNIPQLRLDVTELQNGLKSNQALSYEGSSINAENTLEGRTEGMRIKGKTMYKKKDGAYTDTWEEGVALESFGEKEGNKISILSSNSNLVKIAYKEEVNGSNGKFTESNIFFRTDFIKSNNKTYYLKTLENYRFTNIYLYDANKNYIGRGSFSSVDSLSPQSDYFILSGRKEDRSPLDSDFKKKICITESKIDEFIENIHNKKDILIKEPLRSVGNIQDVLYEDNGQVKIDKYVKQYTFTGDEENISINMSYNTESMAVFSIVSDVFNDKKEVSSQYDATSLFCNNFLCGSWFDVYSSKVSKEMIASSTDNNSVIYFKILKSKLTTPDVNGFKVWLKANPTTIVYQLATPTVEIVENCVDIDLDTFQGKTYFSIENSLPGTLDFKVPSNIASIVQNTAREVNNIWDVINNLLVPSLIDINKNVAMATIKNNLK
ncbi:hypothetical protein QTH28_00250 [Clostridium perfringens]|nr:hypothetical protein [Clostridium perfringens]